MVETVSITRRFRCMAAAVLLAAALWVCASGAYAQAGETADTSPDPRPLSEIHAEFLEDEDLQLEWPEAEPEDEAEPTPGWLRILSIFLGRILSGLGPLFEVLFYLLCALGVGAIAWYAGRSLLESKFPSLRRKRAEPIEDSTAEPYRPDETAARSLLEEADALAAAGRFAEAVHLLLFRSIEDIQTRRDGGVPKSLTAREIARLDSLPDRARSGLSPIIQIVERSFFGGRAVDRDGWQSARASYEDFAFGEAWA